MKAKILLSMVLVSVIFFCGCKSKQDEPLKPDYDAPLLPGQQALRKITDPALIPDFTLACFNTRNLLESVERSISYMNKPSSKNFFPSNGITHEHALKSLMQFKQLLESGQTGPELNRAIRDQFDVYMSVGCDNRGTVLFTGYYTPIFDGALEPGGKYAYPLYKKPPDLMKGPMGEILGQEGPGGQVSQYPDRTTIESTGMLAGQELVWLTDPFEVYIAHVQGSAKIRLPDGSLKGVGYAANNGHEYNSIGQEMINDGVLRKDQLSLAGMIAYFKQHPDQVANYTARNPRFVFFRFEEGPPRGSLNEPVTAYRSIATDKSIFPRASVTFIQTYLPFEIGGVTAQQVYSGFACDQDTGGAIRAPGRCDVYMGEGDTAGKLAGQTYQEGKLYYLFTKDSLSSIYF